jgi:hypothetical protein
MSDDLKQELNAELSRLIREYDERGLDPDDIGEAMLWHSELATVRSEP